MHDIIIDDTQNTFAATTQMEQRQEKLKKEAKAKNKKTRTWSKYLIDWVEKALLMAALISLNFIVYAGAGSYNMYEGNMLLTSEVLTILTGILILSVIAVYLLSFSSLLQNLLVSAVVYYFIIAMLNQFAAFDKNAMLSSFAATYISPDLGLLLTHVSHIVLALILAAITFLYLTFASKLSIFILLLITIFFNTAAVYVQYVDKNERQKFDVVQEDIISIKGKPGKRFIYIGMPNLTSYAYLEDMSKKLPAGSKELKDIQKSMDIILGFYAKNKFQYYPQTYVNDTDPAQNFAQVLNANSKKEPEQYLQKHIYADSFWKFNRTNNKHIYMKESRIYKTFKRSKFNINAYQTSGIELCKINNEMYVNRCVEKNNLPIDYDDMTLSSGQKVKILLAQWLESTGIFNNMQGIYTVLRTIFDVEKTPLIGMSYANIDVKNSADVLQILSQDLEKANGNMAYFVNFGLPNGTYIYDEYCRIKPQDQWYNKQDFAWSKDVNNEAKRQAYAQQIRCIYGTLQNFLDKINAKGERKDTVVFIQGLSGLNGLNVPSDKDNFLDEFMNQKFVDTAIKDPLKSEFKMKNEVCTAPDVLNQYLYRQTQCPEFKGMNFDNNLMSKITEKLHTFSVSDEKVQNAVRAFDTWYKEWKSKQKTSKPQQTASKKKASTQNKKADNSKAVATTEVKEKSAEKTTAQPSTAPAKDKSKAQNNKEEPLNEILSEKKVESINAPVPLVKEEAEIKVEPMPKVTEKATVQGSGQAMENKD